MPDTSAPSSIGVTTDAALGGFIGQLNDNSGLSAMMVGGFGFRLGRAGTLALGNTSGLRALSYGVGISTEVSAFELTHRALTTPFPLTLSLEGEGARRASEGASRNLWHWSGPGGLRQGLFSSFISFGTLRGAGRLAQGENLIFRHFLQDSAMVFGHQATAAVGLFPRPQGSLAEQYLHAEATHLQMGAALALGHGFTGGNLQAMERGLELSLPSPLPPSPSLRRGNGEGFISPRLVEGMSLSSPLDPTEPLRMSSLPPSGAEASGIRFLPEFYEASQSQSLRRRFFPLLSQGVPNHYAHEILEAVLNIPFGTPDARERSLEVLAERSNRGSVQQLFLARALYEAMASRPLSNSTRSYSELLIAFLAERIFSEGSPFRARAGLHRLFNLMERDPTVRNLENLILKLGYDQGLRAETTPLYPPEFIQRHAAQAVRRWTCFRPEEQALLWNEVYRLSGGSERRAQELITIFGEAGETGRYAMEEVHRVLETARRHPLGLLFLNRFLQTLTVEDIPEKLGDLHNGPSEEIFELWERFDREGISLQERARRLNGSPHTARFDDPRLARKVASVYEETYRLTRERPEERDRALRNLLAAYEVWKRSGAPLDVESLLNLLQAHRSEQTDSLVTSYRRGGFELILLSGEDFDRRILEWGQSPNCRIGLFRQALSPGERHRIFLREMPEIDTRTTEGNDAAFSEIATRLKSLIHEWEHWRHVTGNYEGIERGSEPIPLTGIGRRERLISEIMAYLEESRWRFLNLKEDDLAQVASRLGEPLPLYLRNFADHSYFSRVNQRLMRELLGEGPEDR